MTDIKPDAEKFRCQCCGHFPREVVDEYSLDTWVQYGYSFGIGDWEQLFCCCSEEALDLFFERFMEDCTALRLQILVAIAESDMDTNHDRTLN